MSVSNQGIHFNRIVIDRIVSVLHNTKIIASLFEKKALSMRVCELRIDIYRYTLRILIKIKYMLNRYVKSSYTQQITSLVSVAFLTEKIIQLLGALRETTLVIYCQHYATLTKGSADAADSSTIYY